MKNRLLNVAALVGAFAMPAAAAATPLDAWYIAVDLGEQTPDSLDVDLEGDQAAFVRAGRSIGGHWRVEGEIAHRPGDYSHTVEIPTKDGVDIVTESGELNATSVMANVIYDFTLASRVRPFVGIGVGGASFDAPNDGADDTTLAWQGLIGASWGVTNHIALDFAYRYFASDIGALVSNDGDFISQALTVGARYQF